MKYFKALAVLFLFFGSHSKLAALEASLWSKTYPLLENHHIAYDPSSHSFLAHGIDSLSIEKLLKAFETWRKEPKNYSLKLNRSVNLDMQNLSEEILAKIPVSVEGHAGRQKIGSGIIRDANRAIAGIEANRLLIERHKIEALLITVAAYGCIKRVHMQSSLEGEHPMILAYEHLAKELFNDKDDGRLIFLKSKTSSLLSQARLIFADPGQHARGFLAQLNAPSMSLFVDTESLFCVVFGHLYEMIVKQRGMLLKTASQTKQERILAIYSDDQSMTCQIIKALGHYTESYIKTLLAPTGAEAEPNKTALADYVRDNNFKVEADGHVNFNLLLNILNLQISKSWQSPIQKFGFHLYVTVSPSSAFAALQELRPILDEANVFYRVLALEGALVPAQAKFISIYPLNDDDAIELAPKLDEILQKYSNKKGHRLIQTLKLGNSRALFTRYGRLLGDCESLYAHAFEENIDADEQFAAKDMDVVFAGHYKPRRVENIFASFLEEK